MLRYKYKDVDAVTIPDELSLVLSITGCSLACPNCHSKDTWNPREGELLTKSTIRRLIVENPHITCIVFFGGEWNPLFLYNVIKQIKDYKKYKVALFTGRNLTIDIDIHIWEILDYIKLGRYEEELGGLESETTNQRLYKREGQNFIDITHKFWRKI